MKDLDRVERELPSQLEEVANTVGIARMTRSAVDERVEERGRRRRVRRALAGTITTCTLLLVTVAALALQEQPPSRKVRSAAGPPPSLTVEIPASTDSTMSTAPKPTSPAPETTGVTSQPANASQPASSSGNATRGGTSTASGADAVSNTPAVTAPPPPPAAPASAEPITATLTDADGSTSLSLRPGDRLIVRLQGGTRAEYSEPESSSAAVLQKTAGSANADGGAQASFLAVAGGHATVSYVAGSKCSKATPPCLVPTSTVFINVTVTG